MHEVPPGKMDYPGALRVGGNIMSMELWTFATPNGWKVTIMIEELIEAGIDLPRIDVRVVDLYKREQFSQAFTSVNPNQKIPGLRDGRRTVMESCANLLYLAEKYPTCLLPQDESRWDVIQWLFWQAANLGATVRPAGFAQ